jgi:hypothetical protein
MDCSSCHFYISLPGSSGRTLRSRLGGGYPTHPSRSLRYPGREQGNSGQSAPSCTELRYLSLANPEPSDIAQGSSAAPCIPFPAGLSKILRGRVVVSRGWKSASFCLTILPLSQARPVGGLLRASSRLSESAISPLSSIQQQLRLNGSSST